MVRLHSARLLLVALALLGMSACASFNPVPLEDLTFRERVETEEQDGLRVSVTVLSREEAKQAFGVNLQKRGIQPIWLEIENRTEKHFWFMMSGLDPNYFSAHEAAYMNHFRFGGQANKQMDAYFSDLSFENLIESGSTNAGFAFTNETVGSLFVCFPRAPIGVTVIAAAVTVSLTAIIGIRLIIWNQLVSAIAYKILPAHSLQRIAQYWPVVRVVVAQKCLVQLSLTSGLCDGYIFAGSLDSL